MTGRRFANFFLEGRRRPRPLSRGKSDKTPLFNVRLLTDVVHAHGSIALFPDQIAATLKSVSLASLVLPINVLFFRNPSPGARWSGRPPLPFSAQPNALFEGRSIARQLRLERDQESAIDNRSSTIENLGMKFAARHRAVRRAVVAARSTPVAGGGHPRLLSLAGLGSRRSDQGQRHQHCGPCFRVRFRAWRAYRQDLKRKRADGSCFWTGPSLAGGILGAWPFAAKLRRRSSSRLVPYLILGATLLRARQRAAEPLVEPDPTGQRSRSGLAGARLGFNSWSRFTGGYFGRGIGIMMLAAFGCSV